MLEEKKVLNVGVMGYSAQEFDKDAALTMLRRAYDQIANANPEAEIRIVSGYTYLGIPALAYDEAVERGWITVGVACKQAADYDCFDCDEIHLIGSEWGDESSFFLNMCDDFIRVGGGDQSHREIATAKEMGKQTFEFELEVAK